MSEDSILKRNWVKGSAVLATAALSLVLAAPVQAAPLAKVKSATQGATENVVEVTFQGGDGADVKGGLRTFSCTSYTGRRRDARYSSGVIHPSPCEILPERNHRIQESRAPMNSPRAAPLQSRA